MKLPFHITLQQPPAGVQYAIQKGSGAQFEIEQVQMSTGQDLQFTVDIEIKGDRSTPAPDFKGPQVQGKAGERFVYIGVGKYAGQDAGWDRRIKVPLRDISWTMIEQAGNTGLTTAFAGTAKDGTPVCATVKPFSGWNTA